MIKFSICNEFLVPHAVYHACTDWTFDVTAALENVLHPFLTMGSPDEEELVPKDVSAV